MLRSLFNQLNHLGRSSPSGKVEDLQTAFEIRCMDDPKFLPFEKEIKDKYQDMNKRKKEISGFFEKMKVYLSKVVFY